MLKSSTLPRESGVKMNILSIDAQGCGIGNQLRHLLTVRLKTHHSYNLNAKSGQLPLRRLATCCFLRIKPDFVLCIVLNVL